jgi:triosephosphate isomerase
MRRPIIAANWKMYMHTADAVAFAEHFTALVDPDLEVDLVIAPPTGLLAPLAAALLARPDVGLAVQNVHWEQSGAFTGETAPGLAADLGCRYAIVGHSERRTLFGETDDDVGRKVAAVLRAGLTAIICVGESLAQREADETSSVVARQLDAALAHLDSGDELEADAVTSLVVAYEPVWAIGTGRTATPDMAQEVHAFIRERMGERLGPAGREVRIQYGGSVKPANAADLMAEPDIDGALVGGASLDAQDFAKIVHAGAAAAR